MLRQLGILFWREVQPYTTAPDLDAMLKRSTGFQVHRAAAALGKLKEPSNIPES